MQCYLYLKREQKDHICKCKGSSKVWLFLVIHGEIRRVCRDCAIANKYYCEFHECISLDLDDGKVCPQCIADTVEHSHDKIMVHRAYQQVRRILTPKQLRTLCAWVQLGCGFYPRYMSHGLWWMIQAKALRTNHTVTEVISEFKKVRSMEYFIPFSANISPLHLLGLRDFITKHVPKNQPSSLIEARWRLAVSHLKKGKIDVIEIARQFSSAKVIN